MSAESDFQALINNFDDKIETAEDNLVEANEKYAQAEQGYNFHVGEMKTHLNAVNEHNLGQVSWKDTSPYYTGIWSNVQAKNQADHQTAKINEKKEKMNNALQQVQELTAFNDEKIPYWEEQIKILSDAMAAGMTAGADPEVAAENAIKTLDNIQGQESLRKYLTIGGIVIGSLIAVWIGVQVYKSAKK